MRSTTAFNAGVVVGATMAFGVGVVVGAGLATFLAPKSDQQIREEVADKVTGSLERGQAKVRDITGQAIRVADQAKMQVQRVQEAVDAGVRAVDAGVRALKESRGS